LQKKGWFGVGRDDDWGTGSKHFLRELFEKKHGDYKNLFNDILEPLFYDALRNDRSHDDGYYSRFNCKIPFLNGGLFDPIGNYDWMHIDILLPNKLFSNQTKTKEGDDGTGILDVFDRYNFTVKEDEPLEKEVAIDPELLGKSYEKFNAIRPDNYAEFKKALKSGRKGEENKFNKKFGVYYTPREIVHYMCQQSLINYLDTTVNTHKESIITKPAVQKKIFGPQNPVQQTLTLDSYKPIIPKKDIEKLIHTGEQFSENEAIFLKKEQKIKKGEQKTTSIKLKLSDNIRKNAKLIDDKLAEITVCDPAVGSGAFPVGMMSEIVKARNVLSVFFNDKGLSARNAQAGRTTYDFKRRCIEHSLYGVDIDPGAVEIAKLRLWLSLVVDEDDIKNIKPLPNLDYKIVCGNSLLGVEKNLFNFNLFNELEKLKPMFFNETNPTQKQKYKTKIDDLISKITSGHTEFDFEVYFSEVFHQKGGFDVVIANPPYITVALGKKQDFFSKEEISILKKRYNDVFEYKGNTYALFLKRSFSILASEKLCTFIIPNTLLLNSTFEKMRKFLLVNTSICNLVNITDKVFQDAEIGGNLILIYKTGKSPGGHNVKSVEINELGLFDSNFGYNRFPQERYLLVDGCRFYLDTTRLEIMNKIRYESIMLDKLACFYNGIKTGNNKKFIADSKIDKRYRKILRGRDIERYRISFNNKHVLFDKRLLWSNTNEEKLTKHPKIVMRQTGDRIVGALDTKGYLTMDTTHLIFDTKVDILFLLAILNSNLMNWFHRAMTGERGRAFAEVKIVNLKKLPVKTPGDYQTTFAKMVDEILNIIKGIDFDANTNKQAKVKSLEAEIDQLVYKLYDLTPEEIKIVKGENK
jgi:Eco57I restriction-modification methylase/TaqI-like C-terminal specificity domain